MARGHKKKQVRVIYPSLGPLPERLADHFRGRLLVFSDASLKRHGGLAAVMFATPDAEPMIINRTVSVLGSNELELQAAVFALTQAVAYFPGRAFALFSDNQDAVSRLNLAIERGLAQDGELSGMLPEVVAQNLLVHGQVLWVKGHGTCRGNLLADLAAAEAAG